MTDLAILDALCRSPLADVPQHLITPDQIRRVLAGERVEPTAAQKRASLRIENVEPAWRADRRMKEWRMK